MPEPQRTQRQVAEKYKGNLDYYRRSHFFRRLRGITFAVVALGSLALALTFGKWGRPTFYNTGPISQNHAQFIHHCQECHVKAEPDVLRGLTSLTKVDMPATFHTLQPGQMQQHTGEALQQISLAAMDRACIRCHEPQKLHQPQSAALGLRRVHHELPLVFSGACANCHREHVTEARMLLPRSDTCAQCHGDFARLTAARQIVPEPGPKLTQPVVAQLADRQWHFVMPRPAQPVIFQSFADGHPKFGYEQPGARDLGTIKFNHQRHFQADIPPLGGRKITCTDCHSPEPNGDYMERVRYEQHCAQCHSLQFDPSMPGLNLPHRDPDAVRGFARTLSTRIAEYALRQHGLTDPQQRAQYAFEKYQGFTQRRGITNVEDIEEQVFLTGYPPRAQGRLAPTGNDNQEMIACIKCHEVTPREKYETPDLAPSRIADRWLARGPFSHPAHGHLACADCHGNQQDSVANVFQSARTSDILLPKKEMCVACHRPGDPRQRQAIPADYDRTAAHSAMTAQQRRSGGIREDCQSCHEFHAPRAVTQFIRSLEQAKK